MTKFKDMITHRSQARPALIRAKRSFRNDLVSMLSLAVSAATCIVQVMLGLPEKAGTMRQGPRMKNSSLVLKARSDTEDVQHDHKESLVPLHLQHHLPKP